MSLPAFGRAIRPEWPLDPGITYLNHGTVGVTPNAVLDAEEAIRRRIETNPSRHLLRDVSGMLGEPPDGGARGRLRAAAAEVARFLGAEADDLVFVANATAGVNAVLRSFHLKPGDAVLTTEKTYGGVRQAVRFACREAGATVASAEVPCPIESAAQVLEAIEAGLTPRTRLAVLDHIISETGVLLPVREMVALCRARGVRVLVDGAHAPGQVELDLRSLGADYYSANLHKWAFAPRSTGVLWVAPRHQDEVHPTVISWGLDEGFAREFDWTGTRDASAWLAAPAGLEFLDRLGFERLRAYNRDLVAGAADMLCERWGGIAAAPPEMAAFMTSVQLPQEFPGDAATADALRDRLLFEHAIEVPIFAWHDRLWARLSAQVYNEMDEFERLAETVLATRP